jgi:oligopeptide transport system substrate-binding protein
MGASYRCATHKVRASISITGLLLIAAVIAACGGNGQKAQPRNGELRMAITVEPVLDPGKATDGTLPLALFDPLVKLDNDLKPVPNAARSWETSTDGRTVMFKLRTDGKWSSGDPVTAQDFEYSWKRALSPELGGAYSYQLLGIAGAGKYSGCKSGCDTLRDRIGIHALDDWTLEVRLSSPQPWFVAQTAHWVFLPVPRAAVEKYGDTWSEPGHIVTNGPYRLAGWKHNASVTLVKNQSWRDADHVAVQRIEASLITDPAAQLEAFRSGKVDTLDGAAGTQLPKDEIAELQGAPELAIYPSLGVFYLGINLRTISDSIQRRAMALAIDRREVTQRQTGRGLPATSFTPVGMPGYDTIATRFLDERSNLAAARGLMREVKDPRTTITLYANNHDLTITRTLAEVKEDWSRIGISAKIKNLEWAAFLEQMGPPLKRDVDVYALGWIGDWPDDTNFLGLWTCDSDGNFTGFCDRRYDRLLARAARTQREPDRWKIYARLEDDLTGVDGAFPIIPINWYALVNLERESVRRTFNLSPFFGYADLSKVVIERG